MPLVGTHTPCSRLPTAAVTTSTRTHPSGAADKERKDLSVLDGDARQVAVCLHKGEVDVVAAEDEQDLDLAFHMSCVDSTHKLHQQLTKPHVHVCQQA